MKTAEKGKVWYGNESNGSEKIPEDSSHNTGESERVKINVSGVTFGGRDIVVIAGPCAVENREQLFKTAGMVKASGANMLRGGAFKPRTSPYSFQGLGEDGLKLLKEIRSVTGMPVVSEVLDTRHVELVARYVDMLQVGSRSMQNFALLKEVGLTKMPVLLKRGMMATIDELLHAAEYIFVQGNNNVVLCERGIRTFENSTRNTLDLNAVPMLKSRTGMPVIVDPSHGTGLRFMVPAMSKAAIAAGADGLIIEVHVEPDKALSDGYQSMYPEEFNKLMGELQRVAEAVGRKISGWN